MARLGVRLSPLLQVRNRTMSPDEPERADDIFRSFCAGCTAFSRADHGLALRRFLSPLVSAYNLRAV